MRRIFTCAVVLVSLLVAGDPVLAARAPGASPSSAFSTWLRQKLATASGGASEVPPAPEASDARPKPDDSPGLDRRVLAESPLNPWLQPTTFLRVALLMCAPDRPERAAFPRRVRPWKRATGDESADAPRLTSPRFPSTAYAMPRWTIQRPASCRAS